jgi:thiamine kinase-like enzyme
LELKKINNIVKQFISHEDVIAFSINDKGLINQTFVVTVGKKYTKQFILQAVNTTVFPLYKKGLENIIAVKNALFKSDFSYDFPTPITDKYICIEGVIWRLFPFVVKSNCHDVILNESMAFEAAKCIGIFYKSLHNFDTKQLHTTLPNFHNGNFRLAELNKAINTANSNRLDKVNELINSIQNSQNVLQKFDKLNAELPIRVVHFDAKINNFLFDKITNKVKAIIDLDTLMPGTVLSDIGDMIRTFGNILGEESKNIVEVEADFEIIQNITEGFLSSCENVLTKTEKDNLLFSGKVITLLQCIRFLTDYLNNDSYYKIEYPEQNWIRAQNQWALYCSLKG